MKKEIEERLKQTKNREKILNTEELAAVAKIEADLLKGARNYFEENGFTEVIVPHITKATGSCENINTLFGLSYFGQQGYLVQTGQLPLEAMIPKLGNVYCIGPSFRAEPIVDERHLTEFPLIEIEFPGEFELLLKHIEGTISSMIGSVLESRTLELEYLGIEKEKIINKIPITKITYTQAIDDLQNEGITIGWGNDLKTEHEKKLVEMYGNKPLFITHYPEAIKFFNMRECSEGECGKGRVVKSADLILPFGGEAVGSAEREYRIGPLRERLNNSQMMRQLEKLGGSIKDFQWYLDFVEQNGNQVHSGCGIGLNRVTQYVLQTTDIRASTVFPLNKDSLM